MALLSAQFEPIALRQFRYFASQDLDDTRERIGSVLQPHLLTPIRRRCTINSHMDFMRLGGLALGALDFGDEIRVDAGEIEDYYLFIFCLRGHAEVTIDGAKAVIGGAQGVVCRPSATFSAVFSANCEQLVLRIERSTLEAHTGLAHVVFLPHLDLRRDALTPWFAQIMQLGSHAPLVHLIQHNALMTAETERWLISLLLAGQPYQPDGRRAGIQIASHNVRRAEEYIEANAGEAICLRDIAVALNLPVRTLQEGFRRFRDTTPMQHLLDVRLQRVNERLRRPTLTTTVSEVAFEFGFLHLGRFSQRYRDRFGELPSVTLRRALGSRS